MLVLISGHEKHLPQNFEKLAGCLRRRRLVKEGSSEWLATTKGVEMRQKSSFPRCFSFLKFGDFQLTLS
jgi:hypothetical protein